MNRVLDDDDAEEIIAAVGRVANARGMSKIAGETGLSRPSLYKALSRGSKSHFVTILKVLRTVDDDLKIPTV